LVCYIKRAGGIVITHLDGKYVFWPRLTYRRALKA
jgi:hypothetical protein